MSVTLTELIPRIAFAAAIALAVTACGGNDDETTATGAATAAFNTPVPTAGEPVPGEIEAAARELLADELDVDAGDFTLDSSEGQAWSDASLGCPQEGTSYAQVITPGYKLVFGRSGTSYAVHTNSDGTHVVICGDGQ